MSNTITKPIPMRTVALREDVARFAELMEAMMDAKDQEKGPVDDAYTYLKALGDIQQQWSKLSEIDAFRDMENVRRILIHIANFCMIAEYKMRAKPGDAVLVVGSG